jgi:hypothetical protein
MRKNFTQFGVDVKNSIPCGRTKRQTTIRKKNIELRAKILTHLPSWLKFTYSKLFRGFEHCIPLFFGRFFFFAVKMVLRQQSGQTRTSMKFTIRKLWTAHDGYIIAGKPQLNVHPTLLNVWFKEPNFSGPLREEQKLVQWKFNLKPNCSLIQRTRFALHELKKDQIKKAVLSDDQGEGVS